MTLRTNARIAGVTLILYFAVGSTLFAWLLIKGVAAPARRQSA